MARPCPALDDAPMDTTLDPPPVSPPDADPPRPPSPTRLVRRTDDRILGGVASGIADHFGIEPLVVRLAFLVAAFFGGLGVIGYVALWVILPPAAEHRTPAPRDRRQLLGYALVATGLAVIPGRLGIDWGFGNGAFWPLALIATGGAVLWLRTRDDRGEPPDSLPTPPATTPSWVATSFTETTAAPTESSPPPPRTQPRVRREKAPRGPVTAITLSALLILGGIAWLVVAAGWVSLDVGVFAAIALTIVGAGLVVSAWIGRAIGLVIVGVLLALVVGAAGAIDVPIRGGIGDATYRPATPAAVHTRYRMAMGRLELDFRHTRLAGHRTDVAATVGIGRLLVRVPDDVRLVVRGRADVGSVHLLGDERGKCCPSNEHLVQPGRPGSGTLVLDVRVGVGAVDVVGPDRAPASNPKLLPAPPAPPTPTTPPTPTAPPVPSAAKTRTREVTRAAA